MKITGIELKGQEARLSIVEFTAGDFSAIDIKPKKIELGTDETQGVRDFADAVNTFIASNGIDIIAVKSRNKVGEFAGGSSTFKMEGVIQATASCPVVLLSPVTISSVYKKLGVDYPDFLNKYQESAFETACCAAKKQNDL